MLNYELANILHVLIPYMGATISVIVGITISNVFWKARIYRYAKATIIKTLEYQSNKIEQLEKENRESKEIISDLRGYMKLAKLSALKIVNGG